MSKKIIRTVTGVLFFAMIFGVAYMLMKSDSQLALAESVDQTEKVMIGGIEQQIHIAGDDVDNPILLFLHGGPGFAVSSFIDTYQLELRKEFIVVNWDQRGAGESYARDISSESMNIEQFLSDTDELVDYLMEKFEKEKIYLVGHSWGSILGLMAIEGNPEKYHAYVGIGQVIDSELGEVKSYEYILSQAQVLGDDEILKEIEAIGYPPYDNIGDLSKERKWVTYFGGSFREVDVYEALRKSLNEENYQRHQEGTLFSVVNFLSEIMEVNFNESIERVQVPVYFCMGRYDYQTPSELVEEYIEKLEAPSKRLIWFEDSAHHPYIEEADKFTEVLLEVKKDSH